MRILFASTRGAGHIGPLLPFAHACRDAGHRVLVTAPASSHVHVARAGLPFHRVDDPPEEVLAPIWARVRAARTLADADRIVVEEVYAGAHAEAALPELLKLVRGWQPDLILRETCEFASLLTGVPTLHVSSFLSLPDARRWDVATPLKRLARAAGLPPSTSPGPEPFLTLAPRSFEPSAMALRFSAPAEPSDPLADHWDGNRDPLVYVSFASAAIAHQLAEMRVRVLMAGDADLGSLPPNVHVEPWVPQSVYTAYADAMVSHGDAASTLSAMAAGLPLAILPGQPSCVQELGAGIVVAHAGEVRDAVADLLTEPRYARAARAVKGEMAALPPISHAVALLESLVPEGTLAA